MKKKTNKRQMRARHPERNRQRFGIFLFWLSLVALLAFVCRFAYVAVVGSVDSKHLAAYRASQYARKTALQAKRGSIVDRNGQAIAEDASTYTIYAIIDQNYTQNGKKLYVSDKAKTAAVLAKYLPLSEAKILAYLNPKKKTFQVEFGAAGTRLSLSTRKEIEAEHLPGIHFTDSPSRLYPNGVFASYTVGLTQTNATNKNQPLVGVMGLEKEFNAQLAGTNGYQTAQVDNYGYRLPKAKVKTKPAKNGGTVKSTLDSSLQSYLETLLASVQTKYKQASVTGVVMNAKTGEILAAGQRPTFDPSTMEGLEQGSSWQNMLVEDTYEPGSVMKVFNLAGAIQSGTFQPNTYYNSSGVKVASTTIHDWNHVGFGEIPFSQALPRSSNVGFVHIVQQMGEANQAKTLKDFGFGQKTGITLPNEATGGYNLSNAVTRAVMGYGQSINVTQMQILQAATAIANKGTMVQPRVVTKVTDPDGKVINYKRKVVGHPISATTAETVLDEMRDTINKPYGTGVTYKIAGADVAAKTGTANIANPKGGYLPGETNQLHSLLAMAPASDPQFIVYLTLKQNTAMTTPAVNVLNTIYHPLMTRLLALDAGNTATPAAETVTVPAAVNDSLTAATAALNKKALTASVVGTGNRIVQQLPAAGTQALRSARVVLLTNGAMTMPDVSGWSKSDVLKLAQLTGKKFKLQGAGYASAQSLKAGSLLGTGTVTVTFQKTD
ncbi:penicillin-binding protein [Lacticaseibacillus camelliae]|uniref:Cell division protein FtsI n=1 Tax=Lacticaseibacillus camelliae DSM 22697 = JCM 13995 TaxID=1423730 RepID=A0A0R2FB12_9LACO|nr:penicillin-binding protein [Lacticaseibacillus camelliae]KRN25586.1 cell division protein FtsI [Lacticaseibacillus camelliae DSM 22697 = JCM 13995]